MSVLKVYLSPLAEFKLDLLLQYLEREWGHKSKLDFLEKLKASVNRIATFPGSCPESQEIAGVFKCVVTRQTSFYYRINSDAIEVITHRQQTRSCKNLRRNQKTLWVTSEVKNPLNPPHPK